MYKDRLKFLRERIGLTQQEVASIINIKKSQYCIYEKEKEILPTKHLTALANHYQVSIDYLLEFTDKKKYKNSIDEISSEKVGKRLKEFRKENKLTQVEFANILNTVQPVIANYENGKHLIATSFLYQICKKYNISADYLLGRTDTPKYFRKEQKKNL